MSLAEIEKAVDELSPKELTKLPAYITRRDSWPGIRKLKTISPQGENMKRHWRRSTPKSIQAISQRFRDFTRVEVFLEMLSVVDGLLL
jgi:hypothetical protein